MRRSASFFVVALVIAGAAYVGRDQLGLTDALGVVAENSAGKSAGATTATGGKSAADTTAKTGSGRTGGSGPVAVTVASAKAGSLPIERQSVGLIVPLASTALSAPMAGIIASVAVADGANVKAGDLIVQLDDRAIHAAIAKDKAQLDKDQATLDDANRTYERTQNLVARDAATAQSGDDAQAAAKVAAATIEVDRAQIAVDQVTLDNTRILAPFDGQLGAVAVSVGAYVAAGSAVATLNQMKPVLADFTLPETDLALARDAQAAAKLSVTVRPVLATGSGKGATGPVTFLDNAVDKASGTFRLRAGLANDDGAFWPGQSLDVTVTAGALDSLVLVPGVAVQPQETGAVVYVVKPDNTVEIRKVTVALRVGDVAGLSDGLAAGEAVVTEGQAALSNGAAVKVVDDTAAKSATKSGKKDAKVAAP